MATYRLSDDNRAAEALTELAEAPDVNLWGNDGPAAGGVQVGFAAYWGPSTAAYRGSCVFKSLPVANW
jgi:hypothetical protein